MFNIVDTIAILVCNSNAQNIEYGWVCRVNISHIIICLNVVGSKWDIKVRCFRTPDSLMWPFAICFRPSSSVVVRPVLTINVYLLFKNRANSFQIKYDPFVRTWDIYCKCHNLCPWMQGKNGQSLTIFQRSSPLHQQVWKKTRIQNYVDQEALYQIVNFMYSWLGFDSRAGST